MNLPIENLKKVIRKIRARHYYKTRVNLHISYTIEICTICNLKCQFCPSRLKSNIKGIRPLDDFEAVLAKLKKWLEIKHYPNCYITPSGLGEPFIVKNYVDYLVLVKKYIPDAIIHVNSNFTCTTNEQMEIIIRDNLINEIGCSLNYGDRETYQRKCGVDLFDSVILKIDNFVNNIVKFKSNLILNLAMKKDKEISTDRQEHFNEFAANRWQGIVKVHWNDILNWGGLIDVSKFMKDNNNELNFPCYGLCLNYYLIDSTKNNSKQKNQTLCILLFF